MCDPCGLFELNKLNLINDWFDINIYTRISRINKYSSIYDLKISYNNIILLLILIVTYIHYTYSNYMWRYL